MSAQAKHMIEVGFLINFPSKQALFLVFQIAQHIAATPTVWNCFPNGNHLSHHSQHWLMDLGTLSAPKHFATIAQTAFAVVH
jgi:hypothetical protein